MIYYFAYGSNMDQQQMKQRCPSATLVGPAILKDYKLAFTIYAPKRHCGAADILKSSSEEVYGLLYALTPEDLKVLDQFENHPNSYHRVTVKIMSNTVGIVAAETYEVVNKVAIHQKPSKDYLNKIITAAKTFNFPERYKKHLTQIETID